SQLPSSDTFAQTTRAAALFNDKSATSGNHLFHVRRREESIILSRPLPEPVIDEVIRWPN
ncbi:MAG: hypothetical protein R6W95_02865, partial [Desulfosarcina sp.]